MKKTKKGISVLLLIAVLFNMCITSVLAADSSEPKVYNKGTSTLNLEGEFTASGYDAAIYVHSGAKLTINGNGKVHALADNGGSGDKYATAVWANGEGSEITINGGIYTNQGVEGDDHFDLIYAKAGGKIVINAGTFNCATPKWTLNLHDTQRGEIVVKGGTFYKFNPADAQTEPGEEHFNYVAPGYRVVENGDWYTVYKEHTITVKEAEGGKIIVREVPTSDAVKEIDKAISGETVEIVVEPAEGYKFKGILGLDGLKDVAEYAYQFVMPNKDVVLTPVFEKYTVEADASDAIVNQEEIENVILESFNEILKEDPNLSEDVKDRNITVELNVEKVNPNLILEADIKSFKDALSKKEANAKLVTEFIEITVDILDKDSKEHIVSLSELKEPVTLRIPLPKVMEKLPEGYERVFYIVREHIGENGLEYTILDAKLSEDGKYLEFTTDRFSLYAIAYNDVEKEVVTPQAGEGGTESEPSADTEKPETPDVPKTGDNVVVFAVISVLAMAGIALTIKMRKK